MIQQDIVKLTSGHERALQSLEADFNIKLIGEYDRYQVRNIHNYVLYNIKMIIDKEIPFCHAL